MTDIHGMFPDADEAPEPMTERELCSLIDGEAATALGWKDELAQSREKSMYFYLGAATGELSPPEIEGRSQVVSKDVMDCVEWMMPGLMREFCGADDVVRFEPDGPEDEQACLDATAYCSHTLHRKNPGFTILYDAIKSALIVRQGFIKVTCDDRWEEKQERYTGLSELDIEALKSDPEVEIVSGQPGQMTEQGQLYDVVVKTRERKKHILVEGVPPEEMRVSRDCREIGNVRFICHQVERTKSDLYSMGYDRALVDSIPTDTDTNEALGDRIARSDYDGSWDYDADSVDESQRKVTLMEAYVRVDFDKDGISEYRRVVKAGTVIFENEVVEDHPFAMFCPILMPYKVNGLSISDTIEDIQRIKTALYRQGLDNIYLTNNPQKVVLRNGGVDLDALLNPRPGNIVLTDNMDGIREEKTEFVAAAGMEMAKFFSEVGAKRTGVSEFNTGVSPGGISKSNVGSEGVEALIAQSNERIELIARTFAETGMKRTFLLILKEATQYQDREQQIKVNGRWMQVDPRAWKNQYGMTVSVGIGNLSKRQEIMNLQMLGAAQAQGLQIGIATPENIYHSARRLTEVVGYRDVDKFWSDPSKAPPQEPQPDPEMVKAQAAIQLEQVRQQGQMALQDMKGSQDAQHAAFKGEQEAKLEIVRQQAQQEQSTAESQVELQKHAAEIAMQKELEIFKAQLAAQTEREKAALAMQQAIEVAKITASAPQPEKGPRRGIVQRDEAGNIAGFEVDRE